MTKTYIDTGVLIAAFQGQQHNLWAQAMAVLDDASREFVTSDFVRLETLPKPVYERRKDEVEFLETFFESATIEPEVNSILIESALDMAKVHGVAGMDSLHLAAAISANAEEFVTTEKPTKPMFRVTEIKLTSLHTELPPAGPAQGT
jgi:predicted nucleic acid-binding protein